MKPPDSLSLSGINKDKPTRLLTNQPLNRIMSRIWMDVKLNNKNKLSDINGTCQLWLSFWVLSFCTYCSLSKKKKKDNKESLIKIYLTWKI